MPLPAGWTLIDVTGTYTQRNGDPAVGRVVFTSPQVVVVDGEIIVPRHIVGTLDEDGLVAVELPATDDPDIDPVGWTWQVREDIRGLHREYSIEVPYDGGPIDLADVVHVVPIEETTSYLPLVGGDVTGPVTITRDPASAGATSLGRHTVKLVSSFSGGENTNDSTSRLELESYQRAQRLNQAGTAYAHYGEVIRIKSMKDNSKQMIAWYSPASFDGSGNPVGAQLPVFWMGSHYEANDGLSVHGHWSLEVPDSTGTNLITRMEVLIWDPVSGDLGMDSTVIRFSNARVVMNANADAYLHVAGPAATDRSMYFSSDADATDASRRWSLVVDSTAEAGSNAGSNWRIMRYDDSGNQINTALFIERATGAIGVGGTTLSSSPALSAKLDVLEGGSRHTIQARQTTSSTITLAAYSGVLGTVNNRYVSFLVDGDASGRFVVMGDGKVEWGSGGAGGRDVNLFRTAVDVLKTDDSFVVAARLAVGASAVQTPQLYAASDGTRNAGSFVATADGTASLGVLAVVTPTSSKRALDVRVTGDSVVRFRVDGDGAIQLGDGTVVDVKLYRSGVNTLKTDTGFHVGTQFRHLGSTLGFYNATAVSKPTVSGARNNPEAALADLIAELATLGLITDSTTAS